MWNRPDKEVGTYSWTSYYFLVLVSSYSREKLMYDMYPDAWKVVADRQHQVLADQPRRRARKEHSVVPAILQARAHKANATAA
jgi:hypothetical protein